MARRSETVVASGATSETRATSQTRATSATRAAGVEGLVDLLVLALLLATAVVGFGTTFAGAGHLVAAAGAAAAGLALAWLGARLRWTLLTLTAATVGTYFLLGGALAVPGTALARVVPTLETVRTLALGAVTAWKGILTVTPPVDAFPELMVVPYLATLVTAVLAGSLALRAARPAWALLPAAVLFVGVILLGTNRAVFPLAQALAFAVGALAWYAWRRASARTESLRATSPGERTGEDRLRVRRVRNAVAMLGVTALIAGFAAPMLAPEAPRLILRDHVEPPLDLREYPSPLVAFRKYAKDMEETVLFTVSGLPEGERLRLATMDAYTGTVLDVAGGDPGGPTGSGSFSRVGETIPVAANAAPSAGSAEVRIDVVGYTGVWVPTLGRPSTLAFEGPQAAALRASLYANPETGSALSTASLREGDSFTVTADLPTEPTEDELAALGFADLQLPAAQRVPQSVPAVAETFTEGTTSAAQIAGALADQLAAGGVFSSGLEGQPSSRAGHGASRVDELLTSREMVGDDEQFAVAMALMARSLGVPARVVMGFSPDEETQRTPSGDLEIRGADVHAWVEVAYRDGRALRWVPYTPTPDEDQPPQEQDPRSQSAPEPQVLQEPPPPEEPAEAPLQPIPEAAEADTEAEEDEGWAHNLWIVAAAGVPALLLLAPLLLIVLAKGRRRSRRRLAPVPVDRVSGGWREVLDAAVDLGTPVPPSATRREAAVELAETYPGTSPLALAQRADATVFGLGEPSPQDIDAFWAEVDHLVSGMTRTVGPWQRLRARFSPTSLGRKPPRPRRGVS